MGDTALLFITVPLVTAFIGYVTNWAAVKMIFHPSEPVGIGPVKWQGIVYKLAPKFASEIANTTGQVLSPEDMVQRLGAHRLVERLASERPTEVDAIVAEALDVIAPGVWDSMAAEARDQVRTMMLARIEEAATSAVAELGSRAEELVDLDRLVVEQLTGDNAGRLARVAQEIGERELRFIELYGGVFGFVIGIVQAAAFSVFGQWWTMPVVGAMVGLGTNWLAIQMIFRPLEPTRYLGVVTYQGMFPKRQPEIAADYGRIAANEILTPANLIDHVGRSSAMAGLGADLSARARGELETFRPMFAMFAGVEPSDEQLDKVAHLLTQRSGDLAASVRPLIEDHLSQTLHLDDLIEERLSGLDRLQFERMLRGIFEEDEVILVVIGGVLGGLVGALQGAMVLTFGL